MQLSPHRPRRGKLPLLHACALAALSLGLAWTSEAVAEGEVDVATTVYYEPGGTLHMTVVNPAVEVGGAVHERLRLQAGWEADVVTGASVRIVDAPSPDPDVITSATLLDDVRNVAHGGLTLVDEFASLTVDYAYGTESDYRSHSFTLSASADLFERNTTLELSYGRGFDEVCNLRQDATQEPVDRLALPTSDGCFSAMDRVALNLDLHTFRGGWTQAWTPLFTTQFIFTAQLLHGFQSNPYRAVQLGAEAAQEHHPENRQRYSLGVSSRVWVRPARAALGFHMRLYADTWAVQSMTAEVTWDQYLGEWTRLRFLGRYYLQSGANFYSDDYATEPRGQYFTGDRELSEMSAYTAGLRLNWTVPPDEEGQVGFLDGLTLVINMEFVGYDFPDFHYGGASVPDDKGLIAGLALEGTF